MEQPLPGAAGQGHPASLHPHPWGGGGIPEGTTRAAWAAARPGEAAVPWQGFAPEANKGVGGDGESPRHSISPRGAVFRAP